MFWFKAETFGKETEQQHKAKNFLSPPPPLRLVGFSHSSEVSYKLEHTAFQFIFSFRVTPLSLNTVRCIQFRHSDYHNILFRMIDSFNLIALMHDLSCPRNHYINSTRLPKHNINQVDVSWSSINAAFCRYNDGLVLNITFSAPYSAEFTFHMCA